MCQFFISVTNVTVWPSFHWGNSAYLIPCQDGLLYGEFNTRQYFSYMISASFSCSGKEWNYPWKQSFSCHGQGYIASFLRSTLPLHSLQTRPNSIEQVLQPGHLFGCVWYYVVRTGIGVSRKVRRHGTGPLCLPYPHPDMSEANLCFQASKSQSFTRALQVRCFHCANARISHTQASKFAYGWLEAHVGSPCIPDTHFSHHLTVLLHTWGRPFLLVHTIYKIGTF